MVWFWWTFFYAKTPSDSGIPDLNIFNNFLFLTNLFFPIISAKTVKCMIWWVPVSVQVVLGLYFNFAFTDLTPHHWLFTHCYTISFISKFYVRSRRLSLIRKSDLFLNTITVISLRYSDVVSTGQRLFALHRFQMDVAVLVRLWRIREI